MPTESPAKSIAHCYRGVYEQMAGDAAFLWLLRSIATNQPHYTQNDLLALDLRINTRLDGLMTAPEDSWTVCAAAMESQQADDIFAASVLAFRSLEIHYIQQAVEIGLDSPLGVKGLVSALGWLPGRLCHSWIKKFLTSKDLNHKYIAIADCSVRREDPREFLTAILQRDDCIAHVKLYARSLRLIGELKRHDLAGALTLALQSTEHDVLFWATWSSILVGNKSIALQLKHFALTENTHQSRAIELAFRVIPVETAREWITELAKNPKMLRQAVTASAALGDPLAMNWLINQMRLPTLSRLAGEAFSTITGIDLVENNLALDNLPNLDEQFANADDADNDSVAMNDDDRLPFPHVEKIAAVWQQYQHRFTSGRHYVMGQTPNVEHLNQIYINGNQRQRRIAALELALLEPTQFLLNHAANGFTNE